ncbi:MAG: hypothetical protein O2968_17475, partial [Acidobacteria bacterium]|nr:hypothetical protein [Acidobacteriota bacterium]
MLRFFPAAQFVVLILAAAVLAPAADPDDYALAHDHFYNLEYDEAIRANSLWQNTLFSGGEKQRGGQRRAS